MEVADNSVYDDDVLVTPQFPTLLPRVFISGGNSTLVPISAATSLLVSTIAIVGLVLGAIYVFGTLFNPAIRSGYGGVGGLFGPGFYGPYGYNGFYNPNFYQQGQQQQQQTQTYSYEPYSKLGTYSNQNVQSRANQYADSWSSLKILDYIDMMEETWNKLDVHDPDCQKRIVCELYQNESDLGPAASKFIQIFGLTRYLPLLGLSLETKEMLQGLHEAGDKGRSLAKECKEVYTGCTFSFRDTFLKPVKHEQAL